MEQAVLDLSPLTCALTEGLSGQKRDPGRRVAPEECSALLTVALAHDVAHLLTPLIAMAGADERSAEAGQIRQQKLQAVFRCEQQRYEERRIASLLSEEKIPYLFLKGAVLRSLYPEPWMRSCGDLDLLVEEVHWERAVECLRAAGYRADERDSHDVSLYSESGVHVELHFSLTDPFADSADPVLDRVWSYALPDGDASYGRRLTDPFFYYYHIAHMAKHIRTMGGCGIRPFLDLWVLWNRADGDRAEREALLSEGGLLTFGRVAEALARVWFDGETHTELTRELEAYVLRGEQGNEAQRILTDRARNRRGKLSYARSRLFLGRERLELQYPVLRRHPSLLPVCQVRRWIRLMRRGKWTDSARELRLNGKLSRKELARVEELLRDLEIG